MITAQQLDRIDILAEDLGLSYADRAEVVRLISELNENPESDELNIALGKVVSPYLPRQAE